MIWAALLLQASAMQAPPPPPEPKMAGLVQPYDVKTFLERREGCDHWTGEEPYDAARRRQIEAAIADLKCAMIEKDEASLRRKYRDQPAMLRMLDQD